MVFGQKAVEIDFVFQAGLPGIVGGDQTDVVLKRPVVEAGLDLERQEVGNLILFENGGNVGIFYLQGDIAIV